MTTIGLVQVNNSFHATSYLPLSLGFLVAYAQKHSKNMDDFELLAPIYKRMSVDAILEHLKGSDIVAFSVYVWNYHISCLIAERMKAINPEVTILFGGCHVPDDAGKLEQFLRKLPFVDFACPGEGEIAFAAFLDNFHTRGWSQVPSISYLKDGKFVKNPLAPRIDDLNDIPSPFLMGFFDQIIEDDPEETWIGLWETNRGCPFQCTFCDWGVASKKRMADYDLDRLFKEIDWFSDNKIEFVYCCDANFGMYKDRDLAITNKFVENKNAYGFPEAFSVQNTKNSTEASYNIQKVLTDNGLSKGVLIAFQSLNEDTLVAIKRGNIKLDVFYDLQRRFTEEGVQTFSDMILGLPEETYDTFVDGISTLIEKGQHNRIQFNNLSLLPNSEMGEIGYQIKYGFDIVETKQINIHGSLGEWVDNIYETQFLVVGTNTMSREEWVKCRSFSFLVSLLHFDKLLQIPCILMNCLYGVKYKDLIEAMMQASTPALSRATQFFDEKSRHIQGGGEEYCESKEWLSIFWPANEYFLIKLVYEDMLSEFYSESLKLMIDLLKGSAHKGYEDVLSDAVRFNEKLLKIPFVDTDIQVVLDYNIWDVYKANLIGKSIALEKGRHSYTIDRSSHTWNSWDDWLRKVVWYGNKKGAYLYNCK